MSKKLASGADTILLDVKYGNGAFMQTLEDAKKLAEKLTKITVRIEVKAGENGKIFGGVSAKDISENLDKQHQIKVDKKKIDLKETIKTLGVHNVDVKLYEGVSGVIKVDVRG